MEDTLQSDSAVAPGTVLHRPLDGWTVAVVTAGEVGVACVAEFSRVGAQVILIASDARSATAGRELAGPADPPPILVECDVCDLAALEQVAHDLTVGGTCVDAVVNCHFDVDHTTFESSTVAEWERMLRLLVMGPVVSSKAFLAHLKSSGRGAIVHIGSIDGLFGNQRVPSYSAAKGALIPLTHVMAAELGAHSIRVNCVARAAVQTTGGPDLRLARIVDATPLKRAAEPAEIARVVRFLVSCDASYVSGAVLPVDGGRTGITPGTLGVQ